MRRTVASAASSVAATLGIVLLGCTGESPAPPEACLGCGPAPPSSVTTAIIVENRTDHSVTVTVRTTDGIQIDRKVIEGSLSVPIGPAMRGPDTDIALEQLATTVVASSVTVVEGNDVTARPGGVVRVGGGPFVFAVGGGVLAVRTRDGADILEATDPRAIIVLPVEHGGSQCDAARLGEPLAELPEEIAGGDPLDVVSLPRDARGCRELRAADDVTDTFRYRVCVPDAAFPFAENAPFTMRSFSVPGGAWFSDAAGNELELRPVRFATREPMVAAGITLAFAEEATCASVEPECGNVLVPARVMLSFDGKTSSALKVGESLVDPRDAAQTIFLVAGRSRPVSVPACANRSDGRAPTQTDVVLAFVKRSS